MRLSVAIRLGAMLGAQTRGVFFKKSGGEIATCALGAAADALGETEKGLFLSGPTILDLQRA